MVHNYKWTWDFFSDLPQNSSDEQIILSFITDVCERIFNILS